jgi:predicted Zn-dependent protease
MTLRPDEIAEIAASAPNPGATIAIVTQTIRKDLRFARTEVTTNSDTRAREATIIAFREVPGGIATASITHRCTTRLELTEMINQAHHTASQLPASIDAYPLIEIAPRRSAEDNALNVAVEDFVVDAAHIPTDELGAMFRSARGRNIQLFGYGEVVFERTLMSSTTGLMRSGFSSHGRFEVTAKSGDGGRSSWWGYSGADLTDIPASTGWQKLQVDLAKQERSVGVKPGRHNVILSESAVGDLMVDLWWHAQAPDAFDGRSVFSGPHGGTLLGTVVADPRISLRSDPHHPIVPASPLHTVTSSSPHASVFDNGAGLEAQDWIKAGCLESLMCSRAFAADRGIPFSASADTLALSVDGGAGDLSDIVSRTEDGLLITCLWYNRIVDPRTLLLTGLTRDGVYLVKDGEVLGSVGNFRFNDSPLGILNRVIDAGETVRCLPREMGDYAPRVAMPALVVEDFNLSTSSEAI